MATPTPQYDDAPEVAPTPTEPEVYHPPDGLQLVDSPQPKPGDQFYSAYMNSQTTGLSPYGSPFQYPPIWPGVPPYEQKQRWWNSPLVISIIIAFLAIAVVGLAAGTGVAVTKYNNLYHQFETLNDTTSLSYLSNGCTNRGINSTGQTYTTQNNSDTKKYKVRCWSNINSTPFYSLFANSFNGCMESCSIWNSKNLNVSCKSVNYIPAWNDIYNAWHQSYAPGNCYLKPGSRFDGTAPGMEVDSAILED